MVKVCGCLSLSHHSMRQPASAKSAKSPRRFHHSFATERLSIPLLWEALAYGNIDDPLPEDGAYYVNRLAGWGCGFPSKPGILQSDILLALPHRARMVRQRRVGLRRRRRRMRTGVPVAGRLRLRAMLRGSSVMALRMRRWPRYQVSPR